MDLSRSILISIFTISLLFLNACAPVKPADHLAEIRKNGIIRVGTTPDYPPFEALDESGHHQGFDIDLMSLVAAELGVKLEWVDYPYENLVPALQRKEIDLIVSAYYENEKVKSKVDFSDAYLTPTDALVGLASSNIQIKSPDEIADYKTGVLLGSLQDGWLTSLLERKDLPLSAHAARYYCLDAAVGDMQKHKVDMLMLDLYQAEKLAPRNNLKVLYISELSARPLRMVLPKGDEKFQLIINSIIQRLIEDGTIDRLIRSYY